MTNDLQTFKEDIMEKEFATAVRSFLYGKSHEAVLNMEKHEIVHVVLKMLYDTNKDLFKFYFEKLSPNFIIAIAEEVLDIIPSYLA